MERCFSTPNRSPRPLHVRSASCTSSSISRVEARRRSSAASRAVCARADSTSASSPSIPTGSPMRSGRSSPFRSPRSNGAAGRISGAFARIGRSAASEPPGHRARASACRQICGSHRIDLGGRAGARVHGTRRRSRRRAARRRQPRAPSADHAFRRLHRRTTPRFCRARTRAARTDRRDSERRGGAATRGPLCDTRRTRRSERCLSRLPSRTHDAAKKPWDRTRSVRTRLSGTIRRRI